MELDSRINPNEQPVLWRRPWWLHAGVAASVWALLVAYGSLIPFDFALSRAQLTMFILSSERSPIDDLVLNLLLYVPMGMLLRLAWRRWWLASLGVVAMSYTLECIQGLSPMRVGAWQDVVSNSVPGILAAAAAPWCVQFFQWFVFHVYRKTASPMLAFSSWLNRVRRLPATMLTVVAINALLLGLWSTTLASPVRPSQSTAINWLPFGEHFTRSYDKAAMFLGESLIVYCVLGMLLSIVLMRRSQRHPLIWIALLVGVLVGALELMRSMLGRDHADVTEPIVALIAVGMVFTTGWLFVHALRCSCRRRNEVHVEHDRRRQRHDYTFAVPR